MVAQKSCENRFEFEASGRPRVAVCIDTRDGPGRERVFGVYEFATQRGWHLFLVRQDEEQAVERVAEMKVHGAILYDRSAFFHGRLRERGVFCVETSSRNLELDDAAIYPNDCAVAEAAARHLLGLKLEHFAYCGLPSRSGPSTARDEGFAACLRTHGFSSSSFHYDGGDSETSLAALAGWLQSLKKPCGLFAFDDRMAERIYTVCRWAGLSVPEDIALVGVGDDELICELMAPGLSSVRIPTRVIGMRAAEVVEAHLLGRPFEKRQELPPAELVVRASSERQLKDDAGVSAAIGLIKARAHRPFGTDQLVEAVGIPRRTLERRFLASTGKTVHEYLMDYRLHLAKRMLRRSRGPLNEVAQRCGYSAISAFTRMFVEREGVHPEDYRRSFGLFG